MNGAGLTPLMPALLVSHALHQIYGATLASRAAAQRFPLEIMVLPADSAARLPESECARVDAAFFSPDVHPDHSRQFFSTVRKAPKLQWLQVFNAGVDHPIFAEMLARGVRLTTAAGSTAEPIAQTAIAGLLMLARNVPRWLAGQRERRWDPMRVPEFPRDLRGQTVLVLGLGAIGREFSRLARVLGLQVIGIRRNVAAPGAPVDAVYPPDQLHAQLPRADWLVIACPLTAETRGLIDAAALARLPAGARVINVARGEIVDEPALIAALASQRLAGAYLDVFPTEPLAPDSPLWSMSNVLITPHNSSTAAGNDARVYEIFLRNLERWLNGQSLENEVRAT
jgi:phosphoglycerate dehydrogenase-like enzyme